MQNKVYNYFFQAGLWIRVDIIRPFEKKMDPIFEAINHFFFVQNLMKNIVEKIQDISDIPPSL